MNGMTMTKKEALAIQAKQLDYYDKRYPSLRAAVEATNKSDLLEDDVQYSISVINQHIPRGAMMGYLIGVDL